MTDRILREIWVGTDMLNVPSNRNGVPVPGQFPYQYDAPGLQNATIVLPLKDNNYICRTGCTARSVGSF
jgi:hypothetical protein